MPRLHKHVAATHSVLSCWWQPLGCRLGRHRVRVSHGAVAAVSCHTCSRSLLPPLAGFTDQLLQSKRWLCGSRPRCPAAPVWEIILTMTPASQLLFMRRVVTCYSSKALKLRASVRTRCRLSPDEWDRLADYACILRRVVEAVRTTTGLDDTVVESLKKSFLGGCARSRFRTTCPHLGLWACLSTAPRESPTCEQRV